MGDFNADALNNAKVLVQRLEAAHPHDPNKVSAGIMKFMSDADRHTGEDRLMQVRTAELARAYSRVSDGKGGVIVESKAVGYINYKKALEGIAPQGGPLPSQIMAAEMNLPHCLTDEQRGRFMPKHRAKAVERSGSEVDHGHDDARPAKARAAAPERLAVRFEGGKQQGKASLAMLAVTMSAAAMTMFTAPDARAAGEKVSIEQLRQSLDLPSAAPATLRSKGNTHTP